MLRIALEGMSVVSQYEIQRLDGLVESPFSSGELREMASNGNINSRDRIRRIGESSWHDARTIPSLTPLLTDTSGEEDDASSTGSDELAITGSHGWESDSTPTLETENGPSLESLLADEFGSEPIEDRSVENEEETDEGLVSDSEDKPSFESSSGDSVFTPSFKTESEPTPGILPEDSKEKDLEGDVVDIDSSEPEPEIASELEADDDADEPAESSSSSEYAFPPVETDTSDEEEHPDPSMPVDTMPTSSPEDGDEAVPFIREFMGTSAPSTTPEEPKKELNAMTGLSSRTQNALYLILGGLMARPLMTALSSLMGSDSGVGKFLDHIGNLGAIGCTGLGVIMLLSDCLSSKDGESGTEAATSMLIRVAMVFVIVIMLVVLMQLVGEVKLPNPTG